MHTAVLTPHPAPLSSDCCALSPPLRTGGPSPRPGARCGGDSSRKWMWDKIVSEAGSKRGDGTSGPVVRESRGCQGFYTHLGVYSKQQAHWREITLLRSRQEKMLLTGWQIRWQDYKSWVSKSWGGFGLCCSLSMNALSIPWER